MAPHRPRARWPALALLLLAALLRPDADAAGASPDAASLDADVERARRAFDIPGLALAVVHEGRVVLARGYGRRALEGSLPVDADTRFAIASNTKAFTAAALGLLVEDGALRWDDPVARHLPSFEMYDPYVSREITVRDLLTHRSGLGLGQGDLLYFPPSTFTRAEIVSRVRHLRPATSFRSAYAYDNILYIVAGEVVAAASKKRWDDFVGERIFAPLGMVHTTPTLSAVPAGANLAVPHARLEGTLRAVAPEAPDNIAAAGGIHSTARDIARWMLALLEAGRGAAPAGEPAARPVLPSRLVSELWTAQTPIPIVDSPYAVGALKPRFSAYALGFALRDYRGRKLATHTGGLSGMVSRVALVPEARLGVAVLTNQESGAGRDAVAYRVLDLFLGAADTDWVPVFEEAARAAEAHARETEARQAAARRRDSRPSLPLAAYAGEYRDAWYGGVSLAMERERLAIRFSRSPSLTGLLEHWQHDTFVARWRDATVPAAFVTFALRPDGSVDQVKLAPVSPAADFSYDFQDLLLLPARDGR